MKKSSLFLGYVLLFSAGICLGEQNPKTDKLEKAMVMEPVVISATKILTSLEKAGGSSVSVIESKDIESSQQTQLAELLKEVPGLDIVSNGGVGTQSSVFIRGSDAKNTLVLIDGIPVNDPSSPNRSANLGELTLDNVERVEVIRGAQSIMYGSNATAGVINIITKKGKEKSSFTVGAMAGSYETTKLHGSASGKVDAVNYSVAATVLQTEGFSTANDRNENIPHKGNTSEKDGNKNTTVSANIGYEFTPGHELSVIARQIVSETDLDDYSNSGWAGDQFNTNGVTPEPDGEKKHFQTTTFSITAVKLKNSFFQNFFQSSLILSSTERQRETLGASGTKLYEYIGKAEQASWLGTLSFETNEISFGLDQYTEKMESESSYETIQEVSAITTSFWIHDQLYLLDEALILSAGARNDTHEKSGSAATSRFAASYQLDAIKFKASYGTGFRTPSLYELFSQYGNTELKAETSTSWDIGFQHQVASVLYGITYFNISFEDRIDWVSISTDPWGQYQQAEGKTLSNGTETFIAVNPTRRLSLRLDHTKNHTEDPEGNRLKRRPTDKMGLKCNYQLGNSTLLKGSIQWVGDRSANSTAKNEDGTPVSTLNPYTVVNFSVAYDFTKSIKLYMKVDNLTDEFYETAWSYATPGRSFYAGIKAAF